MDGGSSNNSNSNGLKDPNKRLTKHHVAELRDRLKVAKCNGGWRRQCKI